MKMFGFLVVAITVLLNFCEGSSSTVQSNQTTMFIVQMHKDDKPTAFTHHHQWYDSSLKSVSESAERIYTYEEVLDGFAASLTADEAELLAKKPGVVRVQRDVTYEVHTTRTPKFLGLSDFSKDLIPALLRASEVIIGVIDTGIWPESPSFNDYGLPSVPKRWKGECEVGGNFTPSSCNRKLIGARFFCSGYEKINGPIDEKIDFRSPRDINGHGTHTASTAAGSIVCNASFNGYANGTARGMATLSRLAVYKACWAQGCISSDLLAAMDKAVADGVDIMSLSIGSGIDFDYRTDLISVGAFAATTEEGVFVAGSAGNSGPSPETLYNSSPWITTVGAGTLDRNFSVMVTLGNGMNFSGTSLYNGEALTKSLVPLIYAATASTKYGGLCAKNSLIPEKVKGKIVWCDIGLNSRVEKGLVVKEAGGLGMILSAGRGGDLIAEAYNLPTALVAHEDGSLIEDYFFSDPNPTAMISSGSTVLGVEPSPIVATFSSRGPNTVVDILKPDLIAPGLHVLAAWPGALGSPGIKGRANFKILWGTSMSCPHVSGIAALVKAVHPNWSPAMIRSALMTTATTTYKTTGKPILDTSTQQPATPFDLGSGQVNAIQALSPGLVYDITPNEYREFLCAMNYTSTGVKAFVRNNSFACEYGSKNYSVANLNYPSFAVSFLIGAFRTQEFTRILTNVGSHPATYNVSVSLAPLVNISVTPSSLYFSRSYKKRSYKVTLSGNPLAAGTMVFGHLDWKDKKNNVRSQIAVSWTEGRVENRKML